ncbi:hypothetical protein Cgig2_011044 [Carnegiea gigantea]|uniref:Uncharacterized protein n=1 Tax=Carnegiea gigantea TaxID=171969 RepID=A0A9Q1KFW5_9CARY|nr:hypothetical protein Cgig2_011044 [Carnegiea gigantea]
MRRSSTHEAHVSQSRADFDTNYKGYVVEVEDLLDGSSLKHIRLQSTVLHNSQTSTSPQHKNGSDIVQNCGARFVLYSCWVVGCDPTSTSVCVLMMKYSFACSVLSGNMACLPARRQMFTVVNYGLQSVNLWGADRLQPWNFGILLILASRLSPHPHPYLYLNVQEADVRRAKPWSVTGKSMGN